MKIRDIRQTTQERQQFSKRNTQAIHNIIIHQTHAPDDSQQVFHYLILPDGLIEYVTDIEYDLGNHESIDICLSGNFEKQNPPQLQLQATAELASYLLIPRGTTPNLTATSQIISHFAQDPKTSCPGKTWSNWKGYILGTKAFSQPEFLAEYVGQKVILPQNGMISFKVSFKNTGNQTWYNIGENKVKLNVCWEGNTSSSKLWKQYKIPQGSSIFKHSSWNDDFCPAIMPEREVKPGEEATFIVTLSGNHIKPGIYIEDFGLAQGSEWIDNLVNGNPAGKAHCWFEIEVV